MKNQHNQLYKPYIQQAAPRKGEITAVQSISDST